MWSLLSIGQSRNFSMPTAKGTWKLSSDESKSNRKHRNHHYTFDVNHNGVDINGFIVHHDKHGGKKEKKRVYLDSNENGRFDKNDVLIGSTGINERVTRKGAGLDQNELGIVEIEFKRLKNRSDVGDAFMWDPAWFEPKKINYHLPCKINEMCADTGSEVFDLDNPTIPQSFFI